MNKPLDKGRICFVAEKYATKDIDPQTRQPITKNRYATAGRATKWLTNGVEETQLELDSMPIGSNGPVKLYIFWDSQDNNQSQGYPTQQQGGFAPQSQQQGGFAPQQPVNNGYQNSHGFNGQQQR